MFAVCPTPGNSYVYFIILLFQIGRRFYFVSLLITIQEKNVLYLGQSEMSDIEESFSTFPRATVQSDRLYQEHVLLYVKIHHIAFPSAVVNFLVQMANSPSTLLL